MGVGAGLALAATAPYYGGYYADYGYDDCRIFADVHPAPIWPPLDVHGLIGWQFCHMKKQVLVAAVGLDESKTISVPKGDRALKPIIFVSHLFPYRCNRQLPATARQDRRRLPAVRDCNFSPNASGR
jgi:hypothetical protein